jgi:tetratricopeptide (TPR) repeat protein
MTTLLRKALLLSALVYARIATAQTGDALTAMQLEDWDKAISIYTAQTKANPADQAALLNLGNAYLAKGDKTNAQTAFDAAPNLKPESALALVALGRGSLLKDKTVEAEELFERAKKRGKKDVNVFRLIGESYLFYIPPGASKRPNLTRAEKELKGAYEMEPKDYQTLMSLGYCYKQMSNGGLAAQHYEFAAPQQPKSPLPMLMLAKVYKSAKLPEKFLINVNNAISLAPTFTPALREKALFLYFAKKWEDATQAYKDLVSKGDEVKIEDEMQLANCLFLTHDCKGCSELVDKILAKDGSKNYLRRLQAYCDFENNNFQHGLQTLREYFKVVPKDKVIPEDYRYMARLIIKTKGDTLEAISNYRKAIETDSTWKEYLEIGNLYYAKKDNCNAAKAYQSYLDSLPKPEPTDYFKLGLAQFYCKDDTSRFQHALKSFQKVSELKPDASIGWLWSGKAAAKLDPDVENHPELMPQFGKALPFFEKYIGIADKWTPEQVTKNKADIIKADEYRCYYYYNKADAPKVIEIADKILAIDPENKTGKELKEQALKGLTPATPGTPGTPAPPPSGGGKG